MKQYFYNSYWPKLIIKVRYYKKYICEGEIVMSLKKKAISIIVSQCVKAGGIPQKFNSKAKSGKVNNETDYW
jgi:hypothetical protein